MRLQKSRRYEIVILLAALLIYGCGQGVLLNTLSVFIKPVSEELHLSRSGLAAYSSLVTVLSVLTQPLYGRLYERKNLKRLMLTGAIICALVPFGYACSHHLWQFYLLAVLQGSFINCIGMAVIGILINHWFLARKGLATGVAYAGSGVLGALMVSFCTRVLAAHGWRAAYALIGTAALLILVPVIALLVVASPQEIGAQPYGTATVVRSGEGERDVPAETALRSGAFFCICLANFLGSLLCQAVVGNSAAYLSDCGYSLRFQSGISALLLLTMSLFKILIGQLMDKHGGLVGIWTFGIAGILSVWAMLRVESGNAVYPVLMAITMGAGGTGGHVVNSYLTLSYWGRKSYSRVYSWTTVASMAGLAVGGPLAGVFYDHTHSYVPAWRLLLAFAAATLLLELFAYHMERRRSETISLQQRAFADKNKPSKPKRKPEEEK